MEAEVDPTFKILEYSRFWVQRVIVPITVFVGVVGNSVAVMVLTRRRLRSSTNVYLSALAIADIIYLMSVLLLSFEHYPNITDTKYGLYWGFYGLAHWLCDAASSSSVWLTVSFTVERYIAVCHPMRGKVFCTENKAKCVMVVVVLLCVLTTASTTFEYQVSFTCREDCNSTNKNATGKFHHNSTIIHHITDPNIAPHSLELDVLRSNHSTISLNNASLESQINKILSICTERPHVIYIPYYLSDDKKLSKNLIESQVLYSNLSTIPGTHKNEERNTETVLEKPPSGNDDGIIEGSPLDTNMTLKDPIVIIKENKTCCKLNTKSKIKIEPTSLGSNDTYKAIVNWYSSIVFWFLPFVLIATFNFLLINAVYVSQKRRRKMTNSQENISMTNENRITLMLIGVVIFFLICQTPTAVYLIYTNFYKAKDKRSYNISLILGNVFNSLVMINASCNFLLYCGFSKKFRSTFRRLFFEWKKQRQDTLALSMSTKSRDSQRFNPHKHGIRRNCSEYHTPRNLETQSLTSAPRSKSLMTRTPGKAKSSDLIV